VTALTFASDLRNANADYLSSAQALYRWVLAPFEDTYRMQQVETLIVVPDGTLRLVSMGALHDGSRFAIERFAIGTVTGLSMTNTEPPGGRAPAALVAGMSVPGPVVEKLSVAAVESILGTRGAGERSSRAMELRQILELPAVKEEVDAVARITGGRKMLDEAFTVGGFQSAAKSGDYRLVHIASHGFFGGNADTSYIMAFDDLITMGKLQALLQNEGFRRNPIEILSLSACQTAEGDDRSPLGISGAAVKARAKSVLGTLWPVEDNSARFVMESFYGNLTRDHMSKARALQRAQLELLRRRETSHPFFWAPYVLIGNWL
jgi:CHAT domain-containing protein